jgi:hypothetical protein
VRDVREETHREMNREIRQRERALATGAMIRPPRDECELLIEERANEAEIDMLTERRQKLWRLLGDGVGDSERWRLGFDVDSATRGLALAYAAKRRLAVARDLFERHIFAT